LRTGILEFPTVTPDLQGSDYLTLI